MLPEGYSLRLSTPGDAPALAEARIAMLDELEPGQARENASYRERMTTFFRRALAEGSLRAFVIEREGALACTGACCLVAHPPKPAEPSERRAFVVNVWTDPAHRRRGLARALMQALLEDARAQGVKRVDLRSSEAARPLYRALGFRTIEMMRLEL
jgi:ribosomal protein S18 acetylase RimI-like enzyme